MCWNIPYWCFYFYSDFLSLEKKYSGKNALITGASSGIGKDIAYIMADKGIKLALIARREEGLVKEKEDKLNYNK